MGVYCSHDESKTHLTSMTVHRTTREETMKNLDELKQNATQINDAMQKSMDEYIDLGIKVQDEMFKLAHQQMESIKEYTEFALKNQTELFSQFEKTSKNTREMWLEGLKKYRESINEFPGAAKTTKK